MFDHKWSGLGFDIFGESKQSHSWFSLAKTQVWLSFPYNVWINKFELDHVILWINLHIGVFKRSMHEASSL